MKTTTRTEIKSFVDSLKTEFLANPTTVQVETTISGKMDDVIRELWGDREYPDSFALMAIGGYGRATIHPQSDVDLLFFFKDAINEDAIKAILHPLWDLQFKVGHQIRHEFAQELHTLAQILASGAVDQARERLNRFLTERIEKMNESLTGLLSPIQIHFDNQLSPAWTVMEVHSENAFGFVYAVSNALAMQGVYIHKVKIRSLDGHVEDQFFISDLWGRKIEQSRDQERLRIAVTLIKQFTRFLPEAPDPAKAMTPWKAWIWTARSRAPGRAAASPQDA